MGDYSAGFVVWLVGVAMGAMAVYQKAKVQIATIERANQACQTSEGLSWLGLADDFGCKNGLEGKLPHEGPAYSNIQR